MVSYHLLVINQNIQRDTS